MKFKITLKKLFLMAIVFLPFQMLMAQEPTSDSNNCVLTVPFFENFESYPGDFSSIPVCWSKISQEYNQFWNSYYPVINGGSASDTNHTMMFSVMDSYSEYLVLPALDDTLDLQYLSLSFKFKSAQQNTTRMVVGVMGDPLDSLTFVPVDTVWREGSTNAWETKEVNFALYADTGRHIAFWLSKANSTSMFPSCFIDDVTVFYTPDCTPPMQVNATVSEGEATISWTYTNNASGVRIYYKTSNDTEYDSIEVYTDNTYTFDNLPYNTTYNYYLVTICDDNGESVATQTFSFSTTCEAVTDFPWTDSFENGLGCWTLNASSPGMEWELVSNGTNPTCSPFSGSNMIKYNCWNFVSGSWGSMASPALILTQPMTLSFRYFKQDQFEALDKIEVYVNTLPDLSGATLLTTVYGYDPSMNGWAADSVTIPVQDENENMYVIFKATSDYGYNLFMDEVKIGFVVDNPDTMVVVDSVYITVDTAICEGDYVEIGGGVFNVANTYIFSNNDTVFTLNLTINPVYNITINDSITAGETYTQYGFNESATGTYTRQLTSVYGCDSIVTLNLTVLTGVNDYAETDFVIAPNPAHDHIFITTNDSSKETEIHLLDMCGKILKTMKMPAGERELRMNRGNLPNGIYMLRLSSNGKMITRKVIFK